MKENKLNFKQELFCKYYLENKGNGTDSYIKAYKTKNYETAKVNASKLLTNANILERINQIMKNIWFNDINIDLELANLIKQNGNLGIKFKAIVEYNKLMKRYDHSSQKIESNYELTEEQKAVILDRLNFDIW